MSDAGKLLDRHEPSHDVGQELERLMRFWTPLLLTALAVCAAPSHAAPIVYTMNLPVGTVGSAVGTITTDGTIGTINTLNILGYNIRINGDNTTYVFYRDFRTSPLVAGLSTAGTYGDALTATPRSLLFNFSYPEPSGFGFAARVNGIVIYPYPFNPSGAYLNFASPDIFGEHQGASLLIARGLLLPDTQYSFLDGNRIIATVEGVPEPSTWAMCLLGFGFVGFAMRKRSDGRMSVCHA